MSEATFLKNTNHTPAQNAGVEKTRTSNKGFASMSIEKKREIASAGGKAAHEKGKAYKFDSAKASEAGRKGGQSVSRNREHMAIIGKRGGESRSKKAVLNRYDNVTDDARHVVA